MGTPLESAMLVVFWDFFLKKSQKTKIFEKLPYFADFFQNHHTYYIAERRQHQ